MSTHDEQVETQIANHLKAAGPGGSTLDTLQEAVNYMVSSNAVKRVLKSLVHEGRVVRMGSDRWQWEEQKLPTVGTLVLQRDRYVVQAGATRVNIADSALGDAIAGDVVEFEVVKTLNGGQMLARVVQVRQPAARRFVGQLTPYAGHWVVTAPGILEPMLFVTDGKRPLRAGQTLEMEVGPRRPRVSAAGLFPPLALTVSAVESTPRFDIDPRSVFPQLSSTEKDARKILDELATAMGLDSPFSSEIVAACESMKAPATVGPDEWDLRAVPLVTIDGATARDFDDAVFAQYVGDRIRLLVAIADVSHYVAEESELDREARVRGCSVYLPGRVYPMLPPRLSDDLCSLRPGVMRRCTWVSMMVEADGRIDDYSLGFGVMCSWARLTYEQVKRHVEEGVALSPDVPDDVSDSLHVLDRVWRRLHVHRQRRGMLDLDRPEAVIQLSADGREVTTVQAHPRWNSHRMIEECMVATNEVVARFLDNRGWPAPVRSHKDPEPSKLTRVRDVTQGLGIDLKLSRTPAVEELTAVLERLQGTPLSSVLSTLVLRSLPRAEYTLNKGGHYGIGADHYLHFTSPIRRYPDLMVHRLVRRALSESALRPGRELNQLRETLQVGIQSSNNGEERSKKAERFADRALRCRMMLKFIGREFEGTITDMAHFGIFVALDEPFVDGMVPTRRLGRDYFEFDEDLLQMHGSRSGQIFRLGDKVLVSVADVDLRESRVRFDLVKVISSVSSAIPHRRRSGEGRSREVWPEVQSEDRRGARPEKGPKGKAKTGAPVHKATGKLRVR